MSGGKCGLTGHFDLTFCGWCDKNVLMFQTTVSLVPLHDGTYMMRLLRCLVSKEAIP